MGWKLKLLLKNLVAFNLLRIFGFSYDCFISVNYCTAFCFKAFVCVCVCLFAIFCVLLIPYCLKFQYIFMCFIIMSFFMLLIYCMIYGFCLVCFIIWITVRLCSVCPYQMHNSLDNSQRTHGFIVTTFIKSSFIWLHAIQTAEFTTDVVSMLMWSHVSVKLPVSLWFELPPEDHVRKQNGYPSMF